MTATTSDDAVTDTSYAPWLVAGASAERHRDRCRAEAIGGLVGSGAAAHLVGIGTAVELVVAGMAVQGVDSGAGVDAAVAGPARYRVHMARLLASTFLGPGPDPAAGTSHRV